MKVFVTGVGGQLGYDVMYELRRRGHEAIGADIAGSADVQLDITDEAAVGRILQEISPDAVIHCAAWTAVDDAEDAEKKRKGLCRQCDRHEKSCRSLPEDWLQDDVYQHRLCV